MVGKERVHRLFCFPSSPAAGIPPSSLSGASRLAFPIDLGSPLQGGEKAETPASPRNSTDYRLKEGKSLTVRVGSGGGESCRLIHPTGSKAFYRGSWRNFFRKST